MVLVLPIWRILKIELALMMSHPCLNGCHPVNYYDKTGFSGRVCMFYVEL